MGEAWGWLRPGVCGPPGEPWGQVPRGWKEQVWGRSPRTPGRLES